MSKVGRATLQSDLRPGGKCSEYSSFPLSPNQIRPVFAFRRHARQGKRSAVCQIEELAGRVWSNSGLNTSLDPFFCPDCWELLWGWGGKSSLRNHVSIERYRIAGYGARTNSFWTTVECSSSLCGLIVVLQWFWHQVHDQNNNSESQDRVKSNPWVLLCLLRRCAYLNGASLGNFSGQN